MRLFRRDGKVDQNNYSQSDPVPAEDLEAVLADVVHQKADHEHGDHEGHDHAHQQDRQLGAGEVEAVFQQLQGAHAEHDRHGHLEGEAGGGGPGHAENQRKPKPLYYMFRKKFFGYSF